MQVSPQVLLGQLVKDRVITQENADEYEIQSLQKNLPIYEFLAQQTSIAKSDLLRASAEIQHTSFVDLTNMPIDPQAVSLVSESIARHYAIVPYKYDAESSTIYIATTEPFNTYIIDFISRKIGKNVSLVLADKENIAHVLDVAYAQGGLSPEVKEALKEYKEVQQQQQVLDSQSPVIKEAPIAKIVSTILEFAVKSRASDVHIEPQEGKLRVRYRIDGYLQEKLVLPVNIHDAIISRIKILSQMKIDEKRIPQDGRFTYQIGEEIVDLRVSSLPTVHGEKIVMRLLKKSGGIPSLADLGLRGPQLRNIQNAITKPHGIILVTGPTGSGKTTTLYSLLTILNKSNVNIATLEDPVEYQLPGINQVQINPQAGLTFASGLRSLLRQDPNIILVGEIRDNETTTLAIQSALTGHLVFSTLHTNDAATAVPRLIDLGGEPFLITSVLNGVLAQRITRRICYNCKEQFTPDEEVQKSVREVLGPLLPAKYANNAPIQLYRGKGCDVCGGSGYYGRIGIFEFILITPAINKQILEQRNAKEIEKQAQTEGLILMKQDGYLKALDGFTTIEDVLRVAEV